MNLVVTLQQFQEYNSITYYTILVDGKDVTETDDFIARYKDNEEFYEEFQELFTYLRVIGEDGIPYAHRKRLRPEKGARAIPLKGVGGVKLRLYCYLIKDNIMILGNGGHKKELDSSHQDSPALKPHFDLFTQVSEKLDQMLSERDLWEEDGALQGEMEILI